MKTLVLGLGNPLLTDDAVGLRVTRKLRSRLAREPDVEVAEDYHGGLRLMERLIGFDRAIVVDAMRSGLPPGTVRCMRAGKMTTQHSASAHDANLATALALGRSAGARLPAQNDILLVGVEAADVRTFGETCTPPVEAAIPEAVSAVLFALAGRGDRHGFDGTAATIPGVPRRVRGKPQESRDGHRGADVRARRGAVQGQSTGRPALHRDAR